MKHIFKNYLTSKKVFEINYLSSQKLDNKQVGFRRNELETLHKLRPSEKRETWCEEKKQTNTKHA